MLTFFVSLINERLYDAKQGQLYIMRLSDQHAAHLCSFRFGRLPLSGQY
ncbi:hypothetical protein CZ787_12770 [Halomonas citrativorans]|uniref:Uncharacterized protein n=1 Tax=Halomonas citrativorans TaxID=2742612 RepID=A0A1R4I2F0_9GAMM|nr:hypothetical protein CZ787_12770 [Halomonas citrativorans]